MQRLFSLSILLFVCCFANNALAGAPACNSGVVVVGGINPSTMVYAGVDKRMPVRGCALFAIDIDKNVVHKPANIDEAVNDVINSMPHWMYKAIDVSHGRYECVVRVNGMDYFSVLVIFFLDRWKNQGVDVSKLLKDYGDVRDERIARFQELVCKKIKSIALK